MVETDQISQPIKLLDTAHQTINPNRTNLGLANNLYYKHMRYPHATPTAYALPARYGNSRQPSAN
ncbi:MULTISPECIES: hypothetical protein [Moorena]|uniref:hypothetical protein n=1 Tax=Moorena TaxID=1155738 RepID=UPI0002EF6784|nr:MULTISPECIES: hypothetical protein [Moorena]NEP67687.1 hypothetical protein [Moorena sp. SIO3A5]